MNKRYKIFEGLVHFYRRDVLRDVANNWRGLALSYLLLLCLYGSLFDGYKSHRQYQEIYQEIFSGELANLPALKFDGENLDFKDAERAKVFEVKNKSATDFILFDLNEKAGDPKGLMTVNRKLFHLNLGKDQWMANDVFSIAALVGLDGENDLSQAEQQNFLRKSLDFSFAFFWLTTMLSIFISEFIYSLIFTGLLYFMWKNLSREQLLKCLSFKALFRLVVVSYTPIFLIQSLCRYFDYTNQVWEIVFAIAHVLFIHYACAVSQTVDSEEL